MGCIETFKPYGEVEVGVALGAIRARGSRLAWNAMGSAAMALTCTSAEGIGIASTTHWGDERQV